MALLALFVAVGALAVSLKVLREYRPRPGQPTPAERMAALEERIRDLLYRVWTLEQQSQTRAPTSDVSPTPSQIPLPSIPPPSIPPSSVPPPSVPPPSIPPPSIPTSPEPVASASAPEPAVAPAEAAAATSIRDAVAHAAVSPGPAPPPRLDLEQRIGARWATWVGVVAILFAASFAVKWSIENNLIGPRARLGLGLAAGIVFLLAGLVLHRRRDVPYLSEGLAGLGLGLCYLSLYAGYAYYELLRVGSAFGLMFVVTVLGTMVAVVSERQVTAVLALLGGLLTPVLLASDQPNERVLMGYLVVLDFLVLAIARFRTWSALNRLAWAGTVLLLVPTFTRQPEAEAPVARLALLTALFVLFLLTPLAREWSQGRRHRAVDLLIVAGTAAGYFLAVYVTLEAWRPILEAPVAMALAILYTIVAAIYRRRVPGDEATVGVLIGVACVFVTLAIPLALKGPWITLAWAAEGAVLLWLAPRVATPVAAWGGTAALILAALRVWGGDTWASPNWPPVWNATFLAHLLTVAAIVVAGQLAPSLRADQLLTAKPEMLRTLLWILASQTLSVLLWREPPGLWPAGLLAAQVLVLGALSRLIASPTFAVAVPLAAVMLLARMLVADDSMAKAAAEDLLNRYLVMRIVACAVIGLSGRWLAGSGASVHAGTVGRTVSGTAGVVLLFVLSQGWTRYQNALLQDAKLGATRRGLRSEIRWRTQVGLSVLWTLYAAAVLAWGFIRRSAPLRYGALGLLGLTIFKVFVVDLASVKTLYRMLSFLLLGVVLLLVGLLYQKMNRERGAPGPPRL
jgi:uncharacterized membrane protein